MESLLWEPNFVVGIDFGMTCTGVSYSSEPEWAEPRFLQLWPGRFQYSERANKVPSQVGYDENGRRTSWGFLCNLDDHNNRIEGWFKLYLDPRFNDTYPDRPSREAAVRYYQDYMKFLYEHIHEHFRNSVPGWATKKVEYLFSIPTTWKDPNLTAELEEWLKEAGFGMNPLTRRVKISQTEAEAAAVYAAKQHFTEGDVVLVCDAGGGTTDINILKVTTRNRHGTQLRALNKAEGVNAGSALIDQHVERLVKDQLLASSGDEDPDVLQDTARKMMKDDFEGFKCAYGGDGSNLNTLIMSEPRSRGNRSATITTNQLKNIFDRQLHVMFSKIDDQIRSLQQQHPSEHIRYMVLSGGLGCSPYVRGQLRARYSTAPPPSHNAREMQILYAEEPQLAVVKGLVIDRVQALSQGTGVYTGMCCRVSYGVICRRPYNVDEHRLERVVQDTLDNKKWAEDQIDWLIREGEPVPLNGLSRPYNLKIPSGKEEEAWRAQIVMSESRAQDLPKSMRFGNVRKVCVVNATFAREDFQQDTRQNQRILPFRRKKKGILKSSREYYVAEFDVKVIVGSADLKFQLTSKDGRPYNNPHERITVVWEDVRRNDDATDNMGRMYPRE